MTIQQQRKKSTAVFNKMKHKVDDDLIDMRLLLFHETEKAWLVGETADKSKAVWIPKSQCEVEEEPVGREGKWPILDFRIPEWLLIDKGLV